MLRDLVGALAVVLVAACAIERGEPALTPSVVRVEDRARTFEIAGLAPEAFLSSDDGTAALRDDFLATVGGEPGVVTSITAEAITIELAEPLPRGHHALSVQAGGSSWHDEDALAVIDGREVVVGDAVLDSPAPAQSGCPSLPAGCVSITCAAATTCRFLCERLERDEAAAVCAAAGGGHLATISDAAEDACVVDALTAMGESVAWIGLRADPGAADGWAWDHVDGTSFRRWAVGEPPAQAGNRCVELGIDGWRTKPCTSTNTSVCER